MSLAIDLAILWRTTPPYKIKKDIYPMYSAPKKCLESLIVSDKYEPSIGSLYKEIIGDAYSLINETKNYLVNVIGK
jgi:hypothetical protein